MQEHTAPDIEAIAGQLADELAQKGFSLTEVFFSADELNELRRTLMAHHQAGNMKKAGVGQQNEFQIDQQIRGDYIRWIDPTQALPATHLFLERMQELTRWLNRFLYLGIKDIEAHYALYPPGAGYQRHLDQFHHDGNRLLSFVLYLNENWQETDGGQLRFFIPQPDGSEATQDIMPVEGRMVIFRSDLLEHEVLPATRQRLSLTGWMLNQPQGLGFLG